MLNIVTCLVVACGIKFSSLSHKNLIFYKFLVTKYFANFSDLDEFFQNLSYKSLLKKIGHNMC